MTYLFPDAASIFSRLPRFLRRHKLIAGWIKLTNQNPIQLVPIFGHTKGFADLSEGMLRLILINKEFEDEFFELAKCLLPTNGVFFDVGANYGLISIGLAGEIAPKASFHIFEPNPRLTPWIERSFQRLGNQNFIINQCAVSDFAGSVRISFNPEHTGESFVSEDDGEAVSCITLDDYVRQHNFAYINLMKLDVEGYELAAMKGMKETLSRGLVHSIYFEFMKKGLSRHCPPEDLLYFLSQCGFDLFYCRSHDLNNPLFVKTKSKLQLGDNVLDVSPVDFQHTPEHTDLLAIHKSIDAKVI